MSTRGCIAPAAVVVASLLCTIVMTPAAAREARQIPTRFTPINQPPSPLSLDRRDVEPRGAVVVPDTTVLGSWTFDAPDGGCDPQGWTPVDLTAQDGVFFHVDDFVGLGGGSFGRLVPLQGSQSMWCGARPSSTDPILCTYSKLPGYGNDWDQGFRTVDCVAVSGDVVVDYLIAWDSEAGYDATFLRYDLCDDNWVDLDGGIDVFDDVGSGFFSSVLPESLHAGGARLAFWFDSDGAWSDSDGLHNTDGAVILDSLTVSDAGGVVLPTELFEAESVDDQTTVSGNWTAFGAPGKGTYAALFNGVEVLQEDPCVRNLTCLWGFFSGSTYDYACAGHSEQLVVPYGNLEDGYVDNMIQSQWLPISGTGSQWELLLDVYRDLSLNSLVFYNWYVRSLVSGCPKSWQNRDFAGYYGAQKDWFRMRQLIGDLIHPSATHVQVMLGVHDLCGIWCGTYGDGSCHSHSPLFDNIALLRIDSNGPQWTVRDMNLFQDNFAGDGTTTGTVRADMARDIRPGSDPTIDPGDSCVVTVGDPEVGLAGDSHTGFGSAVYAYVGVWPQNQAGKSGPALSDDAFRWPVVDSLVYGGNKWYAVRMDTAFTGSGRQNPQEDVFCVDLNDNLFTPGDTVCFVFAATSEAPVGVTRYYSLFTGPTEDLAYALDNPMEFTCLPTGHADILYVDGYDGLGAQPFFDTAFDVLGITDRVDRYDVRAPSSLVDNGLGSRVVNVSQQLYSPYETIIWNSGDLANGTIGDGTGSPSKSDDFGVLYSFIRNRTSAGGLYISGDNVANEWIGLSGAGATGLRSEYIDFGVTNDDHQAAGLPLSPTVVGEGGSCFDGDSLIVFGGCPSLNAFDVLDAQGSATIDARYEASDGAIVSEFTTNVEFATVGVILSGFSFHQIRDIEPGGYPLRADHLRTVLTCLGSSIPGPIAATAPPSNALAQNYPNPFNPTTTIEFTLRERSRVTLRVYNVAGQLVATLVDGVRAPGVTHRAEWDGHNGAGQSVASGVYFYRLTTKGYTSTRKMVLLK